VKLAFIGGGTMGEAIVAGAIANNVAGAGDITVCDVAPDRREHISSRYGVSVTESAADAASGADVVVLAVKPQHFAAAAEGLKGSLTSGQTVMSIMAGVRIDTIAEVTGHRAIVRTMPNTPATIGEGMTVWTATAAVESPARESVRQLLSVLGEEVAVDDEKYIDMATAVSGSGPAYVFLLIEALVDAAVEIGLDREMATRMVLQTVKGSSLYAEDSGTDAATLRDQVTSRGGTTEAALRELEDAGVRAAFARAVGAAYDRAKELGG
jgi:pyrroline-5-carboxylate reductase